jgi:folate-dependent phosphoribosylglycinamide formyltransferase PurN
MNNWQNYIKAEYGIERVKGDAVRVSGPVRRIAIITIGYHPCACYLARKLSSSGVELFFFNQYAPIVRPHTLKYFRRLLIKRGFIICLDNLFLSFRSGIAFLIRRSCELANQLIRKKTNQISSIPALRNDPEIKDEQWLSVVDVKDINSKPDQDKLKTIKPDLILLAGAPVLSRSTIQCARIACLNPHEGITPLYAGNSPFVWPLYEKRFECIGFTIHLVDPIIDGGPVICQERINLRDCNNWEGLKPKRLLDEIRLKVIQRKYDKLANITLAIIAGKTFLAVPQVNVRVTPPAGYFVSKIADFNWSKYVNQLKAY